MLEVVVGVADGGQAKLIAQSLENAGHIVHGPVPPGWWLLKACEELEPEVAVVELNGSGLEIARVLTQELGVGVVGLGKCTGAGLGYRGAGAGLRGYISMPVRPELLPAMVAAAYFGWEQLLEVNEQLTKLENWQKLRRPLEKAKGIIMVRQGLPPEAALNYLKNMAEREGLSLYELACRICGESPE